MAPRVLAQRTLEGPLVMEHAAEMGSSPSGSPWLNAEVEPAADHVLALSTDAQPATPSTSTQATPVAPRVLAQRTLEAQLVMEHAAEMEMEGSEMEGSAEMAIGGGAGGSSGSPSGLPQKRNRQAEQNAKPCEPHHVVSSAAELEEAVKHLAKEFALTEATVPPAKALQSRLCKDGCHVLYKSASSAVKSIHRRVKRNSKEHEAPMSDEMSEMNSDEMAGMLDGTMLVGDRLASVLFDEAVEDVSGMIDIDEFQALVNEMSLAKVFVKGMASGSLSKTLEVNLNGTVADAMTKMVDTFGGTQEGLWLVYQGKALDAESTLRSYGVMHGDTLHANRRGRGGMDSSVSTGGSSSQTRSDVSDADWTGASSAAGGSSSPTRSDVSDADWLVRKHGELQAAKAEEAAEEVAAEEVAAEEVAATKAADEAAAAKAADEAAAGSQGESGSQGEMAMAIEMSLMENEDAKEFVELPVDVQKALVIGLKASRREAEERVVKDELADDLRSLQGELRDAFERVEVVNSSGDAAARAAAAAWLKDVLRRQDELQAKVVARDAEKAKLGAPSTSASSVADVTPIRLSKKARLHPPTPPSKKSVVVELSDDNDEPPAQRSQCEREVAAEAAAEKVEATRAAAAEAAQAQAQAQAAAAEAAQAQAAAAEAAQAQVQAQAQQMQVQMHVVDQAMLFTFASMGEVIGRQLRQLYDVLDEHQRRALYGILIDKPRVAIVSAPAGAGKSALLKLISMCWEHDMAVAAPTHGARRADQEVIDEVLPRQSYAPRIEARTTFTSWGVGMGGAWDADVVAGKILSQDRTKMKAKETYEKKVVVLDEAAQAHFTQLDMAANVGPRVNGGLEQRFVLLMDGVQTPPVSTVNDPEGREMIWESDLVREAEANGTLKMYALEKVYRTTDSEMLELGAALRNEDYETAWPLVQKFKDTVMHGDNLDVVHDNDETYDIATLKHGSKPGVQTLHARCVEGGPEDKDVSKWSRNLRTVVRKASKMLVEVHVYPGQKLLYQPIGKKGAKTVTGWYLQKGEVLEVIRYDAVKRLLEVRCPRLRNTPRAYIAEEEIWVNLGEEYGTVQLMGPPWWCA